MELTHSKLQLEKSPGAPQFDLLDKTDFEKTIQDCYRLITGHHRMADVQKFLSKLTYDTTQQQLDEGLPSIELQIISYISSLPSDEQKLSYLLDTTPPPGALYHSDFACPTLFRQKNNIYVNKINIDTTEHKKNPLFWWQPMDNAVISAALIPLASFVDTYDPNTVHYNFCFLKTNCIVAKEAVICSTSSSITRIQLKGGLLT